MPAGRIRVFEGDAQHSYRNIEIFCFRRTHARANWVPVV